MRLTSGWGSLLRRRIRLSTQSSPQKAAWLHSAAADGYQDANVYHSSRPSYTSRTTSAFWEWVLQAKLPTRNTGQSQESPPGARRTITALELGAGTGKFTESGLRSGPGGASSALAEAASSRGEDPARWAVRYLATEPAEMGTALHALARRVSTVSSSSIDPTAAAAAAAARGQTRGPASGQPQVECSVVRASVQEAPGALEAALPVSAGEIGRPAADVVVAAQAFHWFDSAADLEAIHACLRPGALFVCLWNTRDGRASPAMRRLEAFVDTLYPEDVPRQQSFEWMRRIVNSGKFKPALHLTSPVAAAMYQPGDMPAGYIPGQAEWLQRTTEVLSLEAATRRITSLSVVASRSAQEQAEVASRARDYLLALERAPAGVPEGLLDGEHGAVPHLQRDAGVKDRNDRGIELLAMPHRTEMFAWTPVFA